jgi:isoleucyl-tRNA synthetase
MGRRLVELGRAARAQSQVKIRQPLSRALISAAGWKNLSAELKDQIADELNVEQLDDLSSAGSDLVDISIKANFRSLGNRFGGEVQEIAKALRDIDAGKLVQDLRTSGEVEIKYGRTSAKISESDLVITETPRTGWSVSSHAGESVALDLTLDKRLIDKGIVREAIRAIQDQRKSSGFDVSDRIKVIWNSRPEYQEAIQKSKEHIMDEVLAVDFQLDEKLPIGPEELGITLDLKIS